MLPSAALERNTAQGVGTRYILSVARIYCQTGVLLLQILQMTATGFFPQIALLQIEKE
jgi:hypothetical protein